MERNDAVTKLAEVLGDDLLPEVKEELLALGSVESLTVEQKKRLGELLDDLEASYTEDYRSALIQERIEQLYDLEKAERDEEFVADVAIISRLAEAFADEDTKNKENDALEQAKRDVENA